MLGRLGFGKPTTMDALLDSRRVVLEDILDMEDCLDQVRLRHKKLIEYIRQPLILSQLIRYLVLGEKYAWLVSEILASAIPAIMDVLVYQHKELLLVYWALLYQNYRLTQEQVVYFVKVNQTLLTRRPADMVRFITCLTDLLPQWIFHLSDPQGSQLADLLVSLVQCELKAEDVGIVKWLHEHGLIQLLVEQLDASVDPMMHSIVQQIMCDIVRLSQTSHQDMVTIGTNELIIDLSSKETMTRLLDIMLDTSGTHAIDSFICGAKLLISLIRYNDERHLVDAPPFNSNDTSMNNSKILANVLVCSASRLEDLLNLLESPRSKLSNRLGMERFVLLELIAEWIHCANLTGVCDEGDVFKSAYCKYDAIGRVLNLFFAFPSCNLAHSVICDMIGQTFENKCLHRNTNRQMILEVFTKARLLHRILDIDRQIKTNKAELTTPLGYMGHLTILTKSIVQTLQMQPDILKTLRDDDDSTTCIPWEEWDAYAAVVMDQCAELTLPLAGMSLPPPPVVTKSTFPLPPPPIHIPASAPPSPRSSSLPSPSLSPLSSPLLPIELAVDAR